MTKRNRGDYFKEMSVDEDISLLVTHRLYRCQEHHPSHTHPLFFAAIYSIKKPTNQPTKTKQKTKPTKQN